MYAIASTNWFDMPRHRRGLTHPLFHSEIQEVLAGGAQFCALTGMRRCRNEVPRRG